MYQFFVESTQVQDGYIRIEGQDVNHIGNVLRMKVNEKVRISSDDEKSYFCHIEEIAREYVLCAIEYEDEVGTELSNKIYLFQGLPKSDKMELIIQKAVELGVYEIIPVTMKNCIMKLDEKKIAKSVKGIDSASANPNIPIVGARKLP